MTRRQKLKRVTLALLVVAVVVFVLFRWHWSRRVDKAIEAIRAQGYPVTLEELDAWYVEPPPGENAADVLQEACGSSVQPWAEVRGIRDRLEQGTLVERAAPLPPDVMKVIHEYLLVNDVALELIHEGAAMPHCRWPIRCQHEHGIEEPNCQTNRRIATFLAFESTLGAEDGDAERACQAVLGILGLARTLTQAPLPKAYWTRGSYLRGSVRMLERVLNRIPLTDEQLARLDAALAEGEDIDSLWRKVVGDRCLLLALVRPEPGGCPFEPQVSINSNRSAAFVDLYYTTCRSLGLADNRLPFYLDIIDATLSALTLPLPERHTRLEEINKQIGETPGSRRVPFSALSIASTDARDVAELRTARLAVAVERYRLAHGALPKDAEALVPEFIESIPEEPCLHEPIRYKQLPSGYVTYSIGSDREDDGGIEEEKDYMAWVSFTVERE